MIDWNVARTIARTVAGAPPAAELPGLAEAAAESERAVSAYTGLRSAGPLPAPEAVSRPAWIDANLDSMQAMLDPVLERASGSAGPLRPVVGVVLGAQVGALSGMLAQRVLGQYEFAMLAPDAPTRLLFVAPNLTGAAESIGADPGEMLRWVALHETTHALQFGGVPWLREHMAAMLRELLSSVDVDPKALIRLPDVSDIRALVDNVRDGGISALVASPAQRDVLDRIQATMAVIEGHAEHVMDAVGEDLLPSLPELRAGLERRRDNRPPLWRILEKLLGLDLKMRQYRLGKAFCDAVVERGGIAALNDVWRGPEALPTAAELEDPDAWLARVGNHAA